MMGIHFHDLINNSPIEFLGITVGRQFNEDLIETSIIIILTIRLFCRVTKLHVTAGQRYKSGKKKMLLQKNIISRPLDSHAIASFFFFFI